MTMGATGYRYKKDLKEAIGEVLMYVETSMFGPEYPADGNGTVLVVGPDAYSKRDWFASVTLVDHVITKVE